MVWDVRELEQHMKAARLLDVIRGEAFEFIHVRQFVTEGEVQQFILDRFAFYKMVPDESHPPIVAFNASAAEPHYNAELKGKQLRPDSLILIDLWARLDEDRAPFADITWMGFYGDDVPREMQEVFTLVVKARDRCLGYIKEELLAGRMPTGDACDAACRDVIVRAGYGDRFIHSTGHVLGRTGPHGTEAGNLKRGVTDVLLRNIAYTIEPGVYLPNAFGVRSEINFYITDDNRVIVTSDIQREWICV